MTGDHDAPSEQALEIMGRIERGDVPIRLTDRHVAALSRWESLTIEKAAHKRGLEIWQHRANREWTITRKGETP